MLFRGIGCFAFTLSLTAAAYGDVTMRPGGSVSPQESGGGSAPSVMPPPMAPITDNAPAAATSPASTGGGTGTGGGTPAAPDKSPSTPSNPNNGNNPAGGQPVNPAAPAAQTGPPACAATVAQQASACQAQMQAAQKGCDASPIAAFSQKGTDAIATMGDSALAACQTNQGYQQDYKDAVQKVADKCTPEIVKSCQTTCQSALNAANSCTPASYVSQYVGTIQSGIQTCQGALAQKPAAMKNELAAASAQGTDSASCVDNAGGSSSDTPPAVVAAKAQNAKDLAAAPSAEPLAKATMGDIVPPTSSGSSLAALPTHIDVSGNVNETSGSSKERLTGRLSGGVANTGAAKKMTLHSLTGFSQFDGKTDSADGTSSGGVHEGAGAGGGSGGVDLSSFLPGAGSAEAQAAAARARGQRMPAGIDGFNGNPHDDIFAKVHERYTTQPVIVGVPGEPQKI